MSDPYGRHRAAAEQIPLAAAVPAGSVGILDLFTRLVEMQVQLGIITEQLKDLADHETRLRLLERFRYTLAGLAIVGGGLSGYVGYLIGRR